MRPEGRLKKNLAIALSLGLLTLPGTAGAAGDSKWDGTSVFSPGEIEVRTDNELMSAMIDYLEKLQLAEADLNDGRPAAAIKTAEKAMKDARHIDDDFLFSSAGYIKASALIQQGKLGPARSTVKQCLSQEIDRDYSREKKKRSKIHPNELKDGKLESDEAFRARYKRLRDFIRHDLPAALSYRCSHLLWERRLKDCQRLADASVSLIERYYEESIDQLRDARLAGYLARFLADDLLPSLGNDSDFPKRRALLVEAVASQKKGNLKEAISLLKKALKVDEKNDDPIIGGRAGVEMLLARCLLARDEYMPSQERFQHVYESASPKSRAMPESYIYKTLVRESREGMREAVMAKFDSLGLQDSEPAVAFLAEKPFDSPLCDLRRYLDSSFPVGEEDMVIESQTRDELKALADSLYFTGYQYKISDRQDLAQSLFWRNVIIYKTFFPEDEDGLAGTLYDLGESYSWAKQFDPAITLLESCVEMRAATGKDLAGLIMTLNTLAYITMHSGKPKLATPVIAKCLYLKCRMITDDALRIYRIVSGSKKGRLLDHFSDFKASKLVSLANRKFARGFGGIYGGREMNEFCSKSVETQLKAVAHARAIADVESQAELDGLLQTLTDSYVQSKFYDQAEAVSEFLLSIKEDTVGTEPLDLQANLWQLAYIASCSRKNEKSLALYERMLEQFTNEKDRPLGDWYYAMGLMRDSIGDFDRAHDDLRDAAKRLKAHYNSIKDDESKEDEIEWIYWLFKDIEQELRVRKKSPPEKADYLNAYPTNHWSMKRSPLKIYIDTSEKSGFGAELFSLVKNSVEQWMSIPGLPLKYELVGERDDSDIYIERVDNYDFIPPGSAGRAEAEFVYQDGEVTDELEKVHLRIYSETPTAEHLSSHAIRHLRTLAIHEFGHALGLGHSPNGQDIMYWKSDALRLSDRDKTTIRRLYGCKE